MFNNPDTLWIEILVVVATLIFLSAVIGGYIYKRVHHLPTGDCAYCHKSKKQLLKEFYKEFPKQ